MASSSKKKKSTKATKTLLDSGFTSTNVKTATNAKKQRSTSATNANATKTTMEKVTCNLSGGMSNSDKAASVKELLSRRFIKPSYEVNVTVTDSGIDIRIICPDPEGTSTLRFQQKAIKMMVESGVTGHFKGKDFNCIVSTTKRNNRIETLCNDVEEYTNNVDAVKTQEPTASTNEVFTASMSEVFVNSSTSSQNTNNVDATEVDADEPAATTFEFDPEDATMAGSGSPHTDDSPDVNSPTSAQNTNNIDATDDVDATDVDAEPSDTFNPEDIAMGDSGSPRTSDSPVLLSEQVGEVTNASIVDNGGDDGQKLSQLLDMMSKMKQQLDNVQAENDGLKQRLTAVESSNSCLQLHYSIMERQLHRLVSGDGAPIVTPRSKHIIKPQLIRFGTGRTLSTVRIDAADRRRMSGTKRRHS